MSKRKREQEVENKEVQHKKLQAGKPLLRPLLV
jgi:hypothetical protein